MKSRESFSMAKAFILTACLLIGQSALASAWFQNRIVQNGKPNVSVTIMRWGVPNNITPGAKKDRIVGQVASDKYENVTLVFEGMTTDKKGVRLAITTSVHVFDDGRNSNNHNSDNHFFDILDFNDQNSWCTLCLSERRDSYGPAVNTKGAKISGGCFFEIFTPTQPGLQSLRLVDVRANGKSVYYFFKFNVSPTLMRTSFKVPLPTTATLHAATFKIDVIEPPTENTPAATPPAAIPPAAADKAPAPAMNPSDVWGISPASADKAIAPAKNAGDVWGAP